MIEILRKRRSVRSFLPKNIEAEKLEILKEAALRAPTSRNINPTEFIIVRNKSILEKLSKVKAHGAEFLSKSNVAFVVIGNTDKSDTCIEDCSIASIIIQLTAESLGLGSCWAQIRLRYDENKNLAENNVRKILNIPDNYLIESIVGIGYPASKPKPIDYSKLQQSRIHEESFN
jgi:nitroreductase